MKSIETVTDSITKQKSNDTIEIQKEPTPSSSLLEKDYVYNNENKNETALNNEQSITKRIKNLSGYRFHTVTIPLFLFVLVFFCKRYFELGNVEHI